MPWGSSSRKNNGPRGVRRLPIIWTKSDDNVEVLRELLDKGADVNQRNKTTRLNPLWHSVKDRFRLGLSPLQHSVKNGFIKCAELIINHPGLNPNACNKSLGLYFDADDKCVWVDSSLHLAAEAPKHALELCQLLISHGAVIHHTSGKEKATPLAYAARSLAPSEVIRCLMSERSLHLDNKDIVETSPFLYAAKHNNAEALRMMLTYERGCEKKFLHTRQLSDEAAKGGGLSALKVVFDFFPDCSLFSSGFMLLFHAIPDADMTRFLLDKGCKALHVGSGRYCSTEAVEKACEEIENDELFQAVIDTIDCELVKQYNEAPNSKSSNFLSFLSAVIISGKNSAERLVKLLEMGFDPNVTTVVESSWFRFFAKDDEKMSDYYFRRAIFSAICMCVFQYTDVGDIEKAVLMLTQRGAEVNAKDKYEMAPLAALVVKEEFNSGDAWPLSSVFEMLIKAGANVNYRYGESPFTCPDVMLAAAVVGNEWVLRHTLERSSSEITATTFIKDLIKLNAAALCTEKPFFDGRKEHQTDNTQLAAKVIQLRNNIATSVITVILHFSVKTNTLLNLCAELDKKFSAETVCQAIASYTSKTSSQSELTILVRSHPDYDESWQEVYAVFDTVSPLKLICKFVIRKALCNTSGGALCEKINAMQLPPALQKYMLFHEDN